MKLKKIVSQIATAFNTHDYTLMEPILADEVIYENQYTGEILEGKQNYLESIKRKFEIINMGNACRVYAKIGFINNHGKDSNTDNEANAENNPCIIITQGDKHQEKRLLLIKSANSKIIRMEVKADLRLFENIVVGNEYPGLIENEVAHNKSAFKNSAKKIAAAFNLDFYDGITDEPLSLDDKEAAYLESTLRPTKKDCIVYCLHANNEYQQLNTNPPADNLEIINWRTKYMALNDFKFPLKLLESAEVISFRKNFEDSINYFHELLNKKKS